MTRVFFGRALVAVGLAACVGGCAQDAVGPTATVKPAATTRVFSVGYRSGASRVAVGANNEAFTLDSSTRILSDTHGRRLRLPRPLFTKLQRTFDGLDRSARALNMLVQRNPARFAAAAKSPQASRFKTRVTIGGTASHSATSLTRVPFGQGFSGHGLASLGGQASHPSYLISPTGIDNGDDLCTTLELAIQSASSQYNELVAEYHGDLDELLEEGKEMLKDGLISGEFEASNQMVFDDANLTATGIQIIQLNTELNYYATEMSASGCYGQDVLGYGGGPVDATPDCETMTVDIDISYDDGMTWETLYSGDQIVCGGGGVIWAD